MTQNNYYTLVTGATSGIGMAFTQVLAQHKHDMILIARDRKSLEDIKKYLQQHYHVNIHICVADLTCSEQITRVCEEIVKQGLIIDSLINNAGMGDWGFFADCDWHKQEDMLRVNIFGLTHLTKLVLAGMIERRRGTILNVASTAAFQPGPLMSVYYASKAYVLSFSLALANEVRDKGVTVTCLCPGPTATRFQERASIKNIRLNQRVKLSGPLEVAHFGYKAMLSGKTVAVHGRFNHLLALGAKILPRDIAIQAVRLMQNPIRAKTIMKS